MAIYWDQCAVTFTNKSAQLMTFSNAEINTGFIEGKPSAGVKNNEEGTFLGSSTSGLLSGCGGTVTYRLDDGTGEDDTLVNITYWTAYAYGPTDNSYYNVGFQGENAGRYKIDNKDVKTESTNGGAGKKVIWTFDIVPA